MFARVSTRNFASKLDNGSSIKNTAGDRTIARPIATRCRCPPDSAFGLRSRYRSRSSSFAASRTFVSRSALFTPANFSANPMLSATDICGYRA